ncbi:MAG: hypothetical protein ACI9QC_000174 [Oceanicoccus sp.]|jgi:hypothetical protein
MVSEEMVSIEKIIAHGAQHNVGVVGELPEGKTPATVIKWPHEPGKAWNEVGLRGVERDRDILEYYNIKTPKYKVLPGQIILVNGQEISVPYLIEMEWVKGRILREKDFSDPEVRAQVIELLETSFQIRKEVNAIIDFIGGDAATEFGPYLWGNQLPGQLGAYNLIFREGSNELVLIDTNLLTTDQVPNNWKAPLTERFVRSFMDIQHLLMAELTEREDLILQANQTCENWESRPIAATAWELSRVLEGRRRRLRAIESSS